MSIESILNSKKSKPTSIHNTEPVAVDILSEFLEAAIHCILYIREIYPTGIFERRKKYNVPVQMIKHPDVNHYIEQTLYSLRPVFEGGTLEKVVVVIISPDRKLMERFVFEIGPPIKSQSDGDDTFMLKLEQSLRSFLLKLNICDATLEPLPQDCSWAIQVHTKFSTLLEIEDTQIARNFPWVEAEESEIDIDEKNVVPLKSLNSSLIKMQLYVEESKAKEGC